MSRSKKQVLSSLMNHGAVSEDHQMKLLSTNNDLSETVAEHESTSPKVLSHAVEPNNNYNVRELASLNPSVPTEAIHSQIHRALGDGFDATEYGYLVNMFKNSKNVDHSVTNKLLEHPSSRVGTLLATSRNTSQDALKKLKTHEDPIVRRIAAGHENNSHGDAFKDAMSNDDALVAGAFDSNKLESKDVSHILHHGVEKARIRAAASAFATPHDLKTVLHHADTPILVKHTILGNRRLPFEDLKQFENHPHEVIRSMAHAMIKKRE